jgi:hypothetical protein
MALPTSFDAAYEAVYEALTTSTGKTRAIDSAQLFKRLASKNAEAGTEAESIKHGKACLVVFRDWSDVPQPEMAPGDRIRFAGVCEITRIYHAGNSLMYEERERARKLASDDVLRVRAALCWPGALSTNAALEVTGIDGGALTASGHRSVGPTEPQGRSFLTWTDLYPITITLSL